MRHFLTFILSPLLMMCWLSGQAQNYPVFNSYYVNPYLYNPAEALNENTQVWIIHRQQWLNVEGAPKISALTFNTLLNDTRAGVGAKFTQYKRGLLTSSDFSATYAYGIPMNKKNWFIFGMSGGAISNQVNIDGISGNVDPDDPALTSALANNLQPVANAGILYRSVSGLNFSLSLPQLFRPVFNSPSFGEGGFSPVDNIFASIYYRRKTESKIVTRRKGHIQRKMKSDAGVAPLELYANYRFNKAGNSQAEFIARLTVGQHFWVGGSYKLPSAFAGNAGISSNRLTIAYSYDPGSQPENGFSQGSHEFAIGLRLGKPKKFKRNAPVLRSTITTNEQKHIARFQETTDDPNRVTQETTSKKMFLVVIKSFPDFTQADALKQKLRSEKYNAEIYYNPTDKKFHVHILKTEKASEAHEEIRNLKAYTKLKEARLMTITE